MSEPLDAGATPEDDFRLYQDLAKKNKWPPWAPTFFTALSRIPNVSRAAEDAQIAPSTAYRWAERNDAFSDTIDLARDVALDRLETTIYVRATAGIPVRKTITKTRTLTDGSVETTVIETEDRHISDVLAMFYIKRWRPEYRESFFRNGDIPTEGPVEAPEQEKVHEAAEQFRAEVIRLSDRRGTGDASSNGHV